MLGGEYMGRLKTGSTEDDETYGIQTKKNNATSKMEDNIGLIALCYPNSAHHAKFG